MIRVSCSTKFHAFSLSSQLNKRGLLNKFYTLYYSQKDFFFNKFHHRIDKENIDISKVNTYPLYLPFFYKWKDYHLRAEFFDWLVSRDLKRNKDYKCFIGWSSMSLQSAKQAKKDGKLVLIERGSSHILVQNKILHEEYKKYNIDFEIDKRIIEKELKEYEIADYVVVPSGFVKQSFLDMGFPKEKIFVNNFGSSDFFKPELFIGRKDSFRILYLGGVSIRKGLRYLFEALDLLDIPENKFEFWIIGSISDEMKSFVAAHQKPNWKMFGHINHYDLSKYISQCDVAVQPSVEEGLSMVIPQMLACGVPVIATINTGGADIITDGLNGFIVPIRNPRGIVDCLQLLYNDPKKLSYMKEQSSSFSALNLTWDSYGVRYANFIKSIV